MPSLPLELHQVLEEEYVAMYGPLPRPAVIYDQHQILDGARARIILQACSIETEADADSIAGKLTAIVETEAAPSRLASSPARTERGRLMLDQYEELRKLAEERDGADGPRELRRNIVDDALGTSVKHLHDIRLDRVYGAIHARASDPADPRPRTALCISGGGIRSATFALGIIQGLACAEVLKKFDYLSTVSGGGYIGSWLSSWIRRHPHSVAGVERDLQRVDTSVAERAPNAPAPQRNSVHPPANARDLPDSKLNPEPKPLRHLRAFSNYMSPRFGLFSADSWTIGSLYLRNLLLNLLVLVPLLALALATPRLFSWGLVQSRGFPPLAFPWLVAISLTIAFAYIGWKRPVHVEANRKNRIPLRPDGHFLAGCVLPLAIAGYAGSLFWARASDPRNPAGMELLADPSTGAAAIAAILGMTLVPFLLYYGRLVRHAAAARRSGFLSGTNFSHYLILKAGSELFAVSLAVLTSAVLFRLLAKNVFPTPLGDDPKLQLYVCFAVPAVLLIFFVQASVFVGLSSRKNEDADREWWGRAGGWLLITALALSVFSAIAVFGPVALYNAPVILGSVGSTAGILAALLGFSDKTPANQKQKQKQAGGIATKAGELASALLVPLFVVLVLAVISLSSTWIIQELGPARATIAGKSAAAIANARTAAHLQTIRATEWQHLFGFLALALGAAVLSFRIGVNKFSMHALYRNRLIRAYLGASRYVRNANAFTGFDENDNVQMWELRQELLWRTSFHNIRDFVALLRGASGTGAGQTLARSLWTSLDDQTRTRLTQEPVDQDALDALVQNLNQILMTSDLTNVAGAAAPAWIARETGRIGYSNAFRNRAVLDHYFAKWIRPMPVPADVARTPPVDGEDTAGERAPMHLINVALNLTGGENLAWQQRKAESFTITPLHSGNLFLGYRNSHHYGGPRGISLGTAVTISGAAASPNMGYHSSAPMAFLLTLFNVRLGAWLGNPGLCGQKSYAEAHPRTNLSPLFAEATGSSNDRSPWVFLSDGGHFENLGLYEMVLRRCHLIVVSDAGADPKFSFDDLGNALRKIRIDLGVPIEIENMCMAPRSADGKFGEGRYVARATIRYSAVDAGAQDGTLIYIKAGVYDDPYFPRDVYNYAQESLTFPHEPTSDQFFTESQFESYRALGRHAVNDICGNYPAQGAEVRIPIAKTFGNVADFVSVAKTNTGSRS